MTVSKLAIRKRIIMYEKMKKQPTIKKTLEIAAEEADAKFNIQHLDEDEGK